jgi:hypothetical protein
MSGGDDRTILSPLVQQYQLSDVPSVGKDTSLAELYAMLAAGSD